MNTSEQGSQMNTSERSNLGIKTWRERLFEEQPQWLAYPADGGAVWEVGNSYKDDEIDDLREALENALRKLGELK